MVQKGNSDPFDTATVPIDPINNSLMKLWQAVYLEAAWPIEASANSRMPALAAWSDESKDIIADEACLHALLACALSLMAISAPMDQSSVAALGVLEHKTKSIVVTRRNMLNAKADVGLARTVFLLGAIEFYSRDMTAALTHFNGLTQLVKSLGGLAALPWTLRNLIIVADLALSQVLLKPPFLPVQDWDPGPFFNACKLAEVEVRQFEQSPHMTVPLHAEIPEEIRDIFLNFRELLAAEELAKGLADEAKQTNIYRWTHMRLFALTSHITTRRIALATQDQTTLNMAARLALGACAWPAVNYCQQLIFHEKGAETNAYIPFKLIQASAENLLNLATAAEFACHHFLLWVFFVGAVVEEIISQKRSQNDRWHSKRLILMSRKLELLSWVDVREVLTQFLYQRRPLDRYLLAIMVKSETFLDGEESISF
jgi:Fungal specific transcription factor domain